MSLDILGSKIKLLKSPYSQSSFSPFSKGGLRGILKKLKLFNMALKFRIKGLNIFLITIIE